MSYEEINNKLRSVNEKTELIVSSSNNSDGIIGAIGSIFINLKEIDKEMLLIDRQFQYVMKKADIDFKKFKYSFELTSAMLLNISNNLNVFTQQILNIPTNTLNEFEIHHRTELLHMVNNLSIRISEMLISLLK